MKSVRESYVCNKINGIFKMSKMCISTKGFTQTNRIALHVYIKWTLMCIERPRNSSVVKVSDSLSEGQKCGLHQQLQTLYVIINSCQSAKSNVLHSSPKWGSSQSLTKKRDKYMWTQVSILTAVVKFYQCFSKMTLNKTKKHASRRPSDNTFSSNFHLPYKTSFV